MHIFASIEAVVKFGSDKCRSLYSPRWRQHAKDTVERCFALCLLDRGSECQ
jgi:hypothetical protein